MAASTPARWLRIVRARRTNGRSRDLEAHASQASRCAGASRGSLELVEQAELFLEQEGAVERAVGLRDFAEQRELSDALLLRGLQQ